MYRKHPQGTTTLYQGLEINTPPPGILWDVTKEDWVKVPIHSQSSKKSQQFWSPILIPEWYDKKRREEEKIIIQTGNPDFFIPECEQVRNDFWEKRLNGLWFMNNGEPTYLTGSNFFYVNFWHIDVGLPRFRKSDLWNYYFRQYCMEDPNCFGAVEVAGRRDGKTYKGTEFVYEGISRSNQSIGGIQSKTFEDSKFIFTKLISSWKKLPHFFKPVWDSSSGTTPKSELRFYKTSIKGKEALLEENAEELESIIQFKSSDENAFDGYKLKRYLVDEIFKTKEVNIYKRWDVHRECLVDPISQKIIGKALISSTVDEMEGQMETYIKFWDDSNQEVKNKNGRTTTGLYRHFRSAADSLNPDKYGDVDVERNTKFILEELEGKKHDMIAYNDYKRKYPLSINDAFRPQAKDCHYDIELLYNRLDVLSYIESKWRIGDFKWVNPNDPWQGVTFIEKKNGKFKLHKCLDLLDADLWNQVGGTTVPIPRNKARFCLATDPFDHKTTEDGRKSNGGISAFRKFDSRYPFDSDKFVMTYANRPKTPSILYEDIIMACWFFGGDILYENNKPGFSEWCAGRNRFDMNFSKFLIHLDGRKEPGIPGTPGSHLEIVNHTLQYIEDCIDNEDSIDLIEEWIKFDINKTTKFDLGMTSGYNLIAANRFMSKNKKPKDEGFTDINDIFPTY